jgi:thymidylate synthase (FAD)
MDKFKVEVISQTENPQQVIWVAMHQDYCENFVWDDRDKFPEETAAGELIVKHLLMGNKGHFGPLEHSQIVFNVGYFPHSMMQQIRTHRIGISFDVQSFRYTGQRVIDVVEGKREIEEVFYLRPVGDYTNRQGKKYFYSPEQRNEDLQWCWEACKLYKKRIEEGVSEEHARSIIPFDARQHFVMSCNARSLMHLIDMRSPANAQLECQELCRLLMDKFREWMPQVARWYEDSRYRKSKLAP